MLIWFDHMGLRVATLVNLSFVGGDLADGACARFLGSRGQARAIPEAIRRFGTWAPLLIPFYIPRGAEWDKAWSAAEAAAKAPMPPLVALTLGYALAALGVVAGIVVFLLTRPGKKTKGSRQSIGNGLLTMEFYGSGEGHYRVETAARRGSPIDMTRMPDDPILPRGAFFYFVEQSGESQTLWSLTAAPTRVGFGALEAVSPMLAQARGELYGLHCETRIEMVEGEVLALTRLKLANAGASARKIRICSYRDLVMNEGGVERRDAPYNALHVGTWFVRACGAIFARNRLLKNQGGDFASKRLSREIAFHAVREQEGVRLTGYEDARSRFLGLGQRRDPDALTQNLSLARSRRRRPALRLRALRGALRGGRSARRRRGRNPVRRRLGGGRTCGRACAGPRLRHPRSRHVRRHLRAPTRAGAGDHGGGRTLRLLARRPQPAHRAGRAASLFPRDGQRSGIRRRGHPRRRNLLVLTATPAPTASRRSASARAATPRPGRRSMCSRTRPARRIWRRCCRCAAPTPITTPCSRWAPPPSPRPTRGSTCTQEVFVVHDDPVQLQVLTLTNRTDRPQVYRIAPVAEIVLAETPPESIGRVETETDDGRALFFRNPGNGFVQDWAFAAVSFDADECDFSRAKILGRKTRDPKIPFLAEHGHVDGGAGDDGRRAAGFAGSIEIEPGASARIVVALGAAPDLDAARALAKRAATLAYAIDKRTQLDAFWTEMLSTLRIKTNTPRLRPPRQRLAALSGADGAAVGPHRPGAALGRLRLPRPVAGRFALHRPRAGHRAQANPAARQPAIRAGRRAEMVA